MYSVHLLPSFTTRSKKVKCRSRRPTFYDRIIALVKTNSTKSLCCLGFGSQLKSPIALITMIHVKVEIMIVKNEHTCLEISSLKIMRTFNIAYRILSECLPKKVMVIETIKCNFRSRILICLSQLDTSKTKVVLK